MLRATIFNIIKANFPSHAIPVYVHVSHNNIAVNYDSAMLRGTYSLKKEGKQRRDIEHKHELEIRQLSRTAFQIVPQPLA